MRVGDSGKNAHPLALEPASALRLGSPFRGGSALLPGSWRRGWLLGGFRDQTLRDQRGKSSFSPSEAESVLTRKWLFEGDGIRKADHWVRKAPLLPSGRNGGLNARNDICAMKSVLFTEGGMRSPLETMKGGLDNG